MKNIRYAVLGAALLFISSAPLAFANTISIDNSSPTTPQPFSVFCAPYLTSFISDNYYIPTENGGCTYSLPVLSGGFHVLQVYKGTVGNSTLIPNDDANTTIPNTVLSTSPNFFNGSQDDDFFMVAYGVNSQADLTATENYLQNNSQPLPSTVTLNILPWKWGVAPSSDTQPPVITINTPTNGSSFLQNDNLFVMASTSDNVGVATTTYTLNNQTIDPTLPLPLGTQPLGTATLVVSASDAAGNTSYATSTFNILAPDVTAPTVVINSPTQGATYFDSSTMLASATVTDASPIVSTSYSFNGNTIDPSQPLPLLGAPLGAAILSVTATDKYGNVGTASVTFTIKSSDVTPPTITITNPIANHTYLSTDTVFAQATATDASGVQSTIYTLNGTPVDPTLKLPLSTMSGTTTLTVTATDNFGNATSSSVSFKVTTPPPPDVTPPTITISSPVQGKRYDRDDIVFLTANVSDASGVASVQYFFDGKPIDPTKPLPFKTVHIGTASTSVIAIDTFGNKATATVTFRVLPSTGNECFEDITDAFNHKLITDKTTFLRLFKDCGDRDKYDNDRNNAKNDDDSKHQSCNLDNRYVKANQQYSSIVSDMDAGIGN